MEYKDLYTDEYHFNQFKEGNELAFKYFFKLYYNKIVGFSIQFIRDKDKANSIAQNAFINLWENRRKILKINGIQSFLYTSAKSECLNLLRHKKVVQKYNSQQLHLKEITINREILNSLKFDSLTLKELEELIDRSIQELPEQSRLVFIKKRFENKKNKEIAIEMGISEKAVEANMTRAIKRLKLGLSHYSFLLLV
ncbi:MAG: RNA polymerase sigma-70 factor [Arenibacter latericius]|nr:RNA polymerase sigma-70 factor [Arenibacter latericius]